MNINITSRKFRTKDILKDYITQEVKGLNRYNDQVMDVNVILSFTHMKDSIKTCEMVVHIPGKIITVTAESEEFEKSIHQCIEKVIRQLTKEKTKKLNKIR